MVKKIIFVIGGLLILVILAALVAPSFISVDTYKDQIKARVEAATGRTMTIDGPLTLQFFPVAGVTVEKMTLSNPPEFKEATPFLTVDKFKIDVAVLPLLHNEIVVKDFVMDDPQINLHEMKNGQKNWLFAKEEKNPPPPVADNKKPPQAAAPTIPNNVILNNLDLKNGTVVYTNDNNPSPVKLQNLNASIVIRSAATAASIEGSGEWNGKTISVKAGLGTLKSLLDQQKMEFKVTVSSDLFTFNADGNYEKGSVIGKSNMKFASLKDTLAWLQPDAKPLSTPAKLAFASESELRCGAGYCSFPNIHLALDALAANGNIKVTFAENKPAENKPDIDLNLNTALLDFNAFLPPAQHAGLQENPLISDALAQSNERWSDALIDLSVLKIINATLAINADSIVYRKITIGKTALNAKLQQGVLTAAIPSAVLYSGTGAISATVDGNPSTPAYETHIALKNIQLEPLLRDVADSNRLTGTANIDVNTKSSGTSQKVIMAALAGDGKITLANGTIKRVNISNMLHNIQGAFIDANSASQNTSFTQMSGSFTIAQGVVSNHDLSMKLQDLDVTGEGTVNLPAWTISYHLSPQLVASAQDKTTGAKTAREGIAVPIIVEGSLDQPKFRPDLNAAVQNALKDPKKLREELKNSRDALKGNLKNPDTVKNLKGLLKGFGGN